MSMPSAPLQALHAAFAEAVTYKVGGAGAGISITAVPSDEPGEAYQGPGRTIRHSFFEIRKADLAQMPARDDVIVTADAAEQRVIDVEDRADVGAWRCSVELIEPVQ